jgi:hypothetical protein
MSEPGTLLATARAAFDERRWNESYAAFAAFGDLSALSGDDLVAFADSAWWLCRVDESVALGTARSARCCRRSGPGRRPWPRSAWRSTSSCAGTS